MSSMRHKDIVRHMKAKKSYPLWRYGAPWLRLAHDIESDCLFLTNKEKWNDKESWIMEMEKSIFVIRPDDTVKLKKSVSLQIMGGFGIAGRFSSNISRVIRDYYIHNLMHQYAMPHDQDLVVELRTGKPINARLVSDYTIDKDKIKKVNERMRRAADPVRTIVRMSARPLVGYDIFKNIEDKRDAMFIKLLENKLKANDVMSLIQYAVMRKRYRYIAQNNVDQFQPIFDMLCKLHKSTAYRHYGAVY